MKVCSECGLEVKETARTCPHCGASSDREASNRSEVAKLVELAIRGDESVWGDIYEKTHRYVYYMALKTLRDDQDAQDITQDVYLQAMRSIGQLKSADSFFGWLRSIIYSKCMDLMKKKKPVLLDDDEDGGSPLDDMPELDEEFLPERVLDNAETRRMILKLVDDLPLQQRQTILYFYYDEMTVEQISTLMECASGTVKSRLNYARQSIKKGVEDHERKGVKLYGMGILPILTILLREEVRDLLIPEALAGGIGAIFGTAAGAAAGGATGADATGGAAGGATAGGVTGAAGTGVGMTLAGKVIIGVVVTAVVATGAVIFPRLISSPATETPPLVVAETADYPSDALQQLTEEEPVSDSQSASSQTPENILLPADETSAPEPDEIFTAEQLAFLERLEKAVLDLDYEAAYQLQSSETFIALFYDSATAMPISRKPYKLDQQNDWRLTIEYTGPDKDEISSYNIEYSPQPDKDGILAYSSYSPGSDISLGSFFINGDNANGSVKRIHYIFDSDWRPQVIIQSGTAVDGLMQGEETMDIIYLDDHGTEENQRYIFNYVEGKITNYESYMIEGIMNYHIWSESGNREFIVDPDRVFQVGRYHR